MHLLTLVNDYKRENSPHTNTTEKKKYSNDFSIFHQKCVLLYCNCLISIDYNVYNKTRSSVSESFTCFDSLSEAYSLAIRWKDLFSF